MAVQAEWKSSEEVGRCQAHDWHGMAKHEVLVVRVGSVSVRVCSKGVDELREAVAAPPPSQP